MGLGTRLARHVLDAAGTLGYRRVERLFGKMKQFRRVPTRYDKLRATFLGMIPMALG